MMKVITMKIGLPKNKNLKVLVNQLFTSADVYVTATAPRVDFTAISGDEFNGTACFLKQKTLTQWVAEGRLDCGVVGYDYVSEFNARAKEQGLPWVEVFEFFDIANCSLEIAALEGGDIKDISDLNGKRVATSYPAILKDFVKSRGIALAEIVEMEGSVEMAIPIGQADAILDIVETGGSLKANGLKSIYSIMSSQAVLIAPRYDVRCAQRNDIEAAMALSRQLVRADQRQVNYG